jgi:acetoin utilization deacetylase AcuC-like enzyme
LIDTLQRSSPARGAFRLDAGTEMSPGSLNLGAAGFAWIARKWVDLAARHCASRVVSALEVGYTLTTLRESCVAHAGVLLNHSRGQRSPA